MAAMLPGDFLFPSIHVCNILVWDLILPTICVGRTSTKLLNADYFGCSFFKKLGLGTTVHYFSILKNCFPFLSCIVHCSGVWGRSATDPTLWTLDDSVSEIPRAHIYIRSTVYVRQIHYKGLDSWACPIHLSNIQLQYLLGQYERTLSRFYVQCRI